MLSDLHAQIQDVFNEFGVQIMSPHFVSQPLQPVFVLKSEWFAALANSREVATAITALSQQASSKTAG